jgi:hypothetical protein
MYNVAPAPGPRRRLGWFPPGRVQCIRWDGASQEASRGFGVEDFERALEPQALEQRWVREQGGDAVGQEGPAVAGALASAPARRVDGSGTARSSRVGVRKNSADSCFFHLH